MAEKRKRRKKKGFRDLIDSAATVLDTLDEASEIMKKIDRSSGESSSDTKGESIGVPIGDPIGIPIHSPIGQSVKQSIDRPYDTPDVKPNDRPHKKPYDTPYEKPSETSYDKPYEKPYDTPQTSPFHAPHASPFQTPYETPNERPNETSGISPHETPHEALYEKPHEIPYKAPHETSHETPDEQPADVPTQPPVITEKEAVLFECLMMLEGEPTSLRVISSATGISEHTLKSCIKRLKSKGLVKTERCNVGGRFGFRSKIAPTPYILVGSKKNVEQKLKNISKKDICILYLYRENIYKDLSNNRISDRVSDRVNDETLLNELIEQFNDLYPALSGIGINSKHLGQIIKAWRVQGLDIRQLPQSLERANFAVEKGLPERVENPLAYVVSSLKRGVFGKPRGFKSRAEIQAEQARKEAERIRKLNEQYFEDTFLLWWNSLSEEEKRKIDALNTGVPKQGYFRELHRKEYFRKHVFVPL